MSEHAPGRNTNGRIIVGPPELDPIYAIEWALKSIFDGEATSADAVDFLVNWQEGDLSSHPEFVAWARAQEIAEAA